MMTIEELDKYISSKIQGVFSVADMAILKEEIQKLQPGDVYVEIGTDEGRSARVAHEYADPGVFKVWIDIHDPFPRGPFMEKEGMVGIGKNGFYIHGDADQFSKIFIRTVDLLFIDGHHDYESVKRSTLAWEDLLLYGGTILFHDYDHPETRRWLDEHYGNCKEVLHGKMVRVRK